MTDLDAKRMRLEELKAQRAVHDHALLQAAWQARREEAEKARVAAVIDPSPANVKAAAAAQTAFEEAGDAVASRGEHLATLEAAIGQLETAIATAEREARQARIKAEEEAVAARLEAAKPALVEIVELLGARAHFENRWVEDWQTELSRYLSRPPWVEGGVHYPFERGVLNRHLGAGRQRAIAIVNGKETA